MSKIFSISVLISKVTTQNILQTQNFICYKTKAMRCDLPKEKPESRCLHWYNEVYQQESSPKSIFQGNEILCKRFISNHEQIFALQKEKTKMFFVRDAFEGLKEILRRRNTDKLYSGRILSVYAQICKINNFIDKIEKEERIRQEEYKAMLSCSSESFLNFFPYKLTLQKVNLENENLSKKIVESFYLPEEVEIYRNENNFYENDVEAVADYRLWLKDLSSIKNEKWPLQEWLEELFETVLIDEEKFKMKKKKDFLKKAKRFFNSEIDFFKGRW